MRCLKCGYENEKSARFCVNCGSRLGIESAKKIQAGNYNNIMNNQNRQDRKSTRLNSSHRSQSRMPSSA